MIKRVHTTTTALLPGCKRARRNNTADYLQGFMLEMQPTMCVCVCVSSVHPKPFIFFALAFCAEHSMRYKQYLPPPSNHTHTHTQRQTHRHTVLRASSTRRRAALPPIRTNGAKVFYTMPKPIFRLCHSLTCISHKTSARPCVHRIKCLYVCVMLVYMPNMLTTTHPTASTQSSETVSDCKYCAHVII